MCFSPIADIQGHSTRFPQAAVYQHSPVGAIEFWHLNGVPAFVTPVQVPANPIHCQAIWVAQGCPVQNLPVSDDHKLLCRTLIQYFKYFLIQFS